MADDTTTTELHHVHAGAALADLDQLVTEIGASYPMLAYTQQLDEDYDEATALDPIILAGLVSPSA